MGSKERCRAVERAPATDGVGCREVETRLLQLTLRTPATFKAASILAVFGRREQKGLPIRHSSLGLLQASQTPSVFVNDWLNLVDSVLLIQLYSKGSVPALNSATVPSLSPACCAM